MIKFTQSKLVVKDKEGNFVQRGNCYATVIGCLLEINPIDVPNIETLFDLGVDYSYGVMNKWLSSIGYQIKNTMEFAIFHYNIPGNSICLDYLERLTPEDKNSISEQYSDRYYIVSGMSSRGVMHVCIYMNGELVHDPHPSREGLITSEYFEEIIRIDE